jgi:hypothetical protein
MDRDDATFDARAMRIDPQAFAHTTKPKKWRRQFVKFPWSWVDRLRDARHISTYRVAFHLVYEHWRNGGRAIALANAVMEEEGVERRAKWRALRELETLGLIKVEKRSRKAPLITLLIDPRGGQS